MISSLLLTLNILVCIALTAVVLLQRSEGGALGMGGGPTGLITTRGAGDLLTRITWILFSLFLILSLSLSLLSVHDRNNSAVVNSLKMQRLNPNAAPAATNAAAPLTAPTPQSAPLPGAATVAPPIAAPAPIVAAPRPTVSTPAPVKPAHAAATHPAAATPTPTAATPAPAPVVITPPPPAASQPAPASTAPANSGTP